MKSELRETLIHLVAAYNEMPFAVRYPLDADIVKINSALADDLNEIALVWSIEDVKTMRPDLTDDQCREVLAKVEQHHDASLGVTWDNLESEAEEFGPNPFDGDDERDEYKEYAETSIRAGQPPVDVNTWRRHTPA